MNTKQEITKKLVLYLIRNIIQGLVITVVALGLTWLCTGGDMVLSQHIWMLIWVPIGTAVFGFMNFAAYAKPFSEIETFISTIAKGDLTRDINLRNLGPLNRFGVPMNGMRQGLNDLVGEAKSVSDGMRGSIGGLHGQLEETARDYREMNENIQRSASAADRQSQSAAECSRAVEEMAHGVVRIAEGAAEAAAVSANAAGTASQARGEMSAMKAQMDRVNDTFSSLSAIIAQFLEGSRQISHFVQTIGTIAQQTNLLALNASIEAARAGEHGRGFAIVAGEVRNLANQTNQSAEQIGNLIAGIEQNSTHAITGMEQSEQEIRASLDQMAAMERNMLQVLADVEGINGKLGDISAVGQQLAAASEEVSASVDDMAASAGSSNASTLNLSALASNINRAMTEIADQGDELHKLSERLNGLMAQFNVAK
ncbi:methyl-accepting chemotaxis protein [Paenibacillus methanolicus]|uniref:Methyl-accepting chemotaxis protein n=1 Tax=Paenibacillus methanolicus TaxID=582686 RepID=A0A5S5CKG9_9BACL|nr:methyl-accepting chemotaxis protein [Paenibacillus methanolicus]TYP79051.1 methyl-accepting chemotaxis protein [Paenibacillus methanolicus]